MSLKSTNFRLLAVLALGMCTTACTLWQPLDGAQFKTVFLDFNSAASDIEVRWVLGEDADYYYMKDQPSPWQAEYYKVFKRDVFIDLGPNPKFPVNFNWLISGRTWESMQRVGGITIDPPRVVNGSWYLPVNCDVSGLTTITVKPASLNSGPGWAYTYVNIMENEIDLTIEMDFTGLAANSTKCGPASLPGIKDGSYNVFYRDPDGSIHVIGKIEIVNARKP